MGRLQDWFAALRERGECGFVAYLAAGDPSLAQTEAIILALAEAGVDVIELGVPFSDPLADGPVIQRAHERALANGVSVRDCIELVARLRAQTDVPIILFTYYNPVLHMGLEAFAAECRDAQVDGALVLDLPPEESREYHDLLHHAGLDTVYLLAPTSSDARIQKVCSASSGFVYYVSREGVTGERDNVAESLKPMVAKIRAATDLPIAVGFGIATPDHAAQVAESADAVVVGSAIVKQIEAIGDVPDLAQRVAEFVRPLVAGAKGIDRVGAPG